jgi:hypothetical protein
VLICQHGEASEYKIGFFDFTTSKFYLRKSAEEINKNKVFNPDLGLYEISFDRVGNVTKKVFWQEKKGKGVSLVIKCLYFKTGGSDCKLSSHVPNYGFNTSYLNVYFHAELLPHWKKFSVIL